MQRQTIIAAMRMQLLGGRSTKDFLSRYWQKRPLLIRGAIPGFTGIVQAPELFRLAGRSDVESRVVHRLGARWRLEHGPFSRERLARLPKSAWTLLVQGLNLVHPAADALLRRFNFIPYARLDDLMVSYAVVGGGVGPHVDSYDVFLLQAGGRRRWRLSAKGAREFDADAPIRVLRDFHPDEEWLLDPGDMLYLPPGWAHEGTALEPCFTYSIGFRAPALAELAGEFLAWIGERAGPAGLYEDPDLRPASNAAEIPTAMLSATERAVRAVRWTRRDVALFLGSYLTAPKPRTRFEPPRRPMDEQRFTRACRERGIALDPRSQMLCRAGQVFINGQAVRPGRGCLGPLKALAHARCLAPHRRPRAALCTLLHGWYLSGWIRVSDPHGR